MKNFENPQYALAIKNNLCSFIGFINDIPAFNNMQGMAYNLCVPINHLIKNGKNTFKIIVSPLQPAAHLEELSECFASVIVKDFMDNASDFTEIAKMDFSPGTSNDTTRLLVFELAGEFEAKLPYEDYYWVTAPLLTENRRVNFQKAIDYFNVFHAAFKNQNTGFIFNEIVFREKELSLAFYDDFEQGLSATKKDFTETFSNEKYALQALDYTGFVPTLFAGGRMVSFVNSNFEQPVFFLNDEEGYRKEFPVYLCMNEQNNLMIVR